MAPGMESLITGIYYLVSNNEIWKKLKWIFSPWRIAKRNRTAL